VFLTLRLQIPTKALPTRRHDCPASQGNPDVSVRLESTINSAFDARDGISTATKAKSARPVDHALDLLDKGEARVAVREASGKWKVNQWLKKAVLLSFRLNDMSAITGRSRKSVVVDKVPSKFEGWGENRFRDAGFRACRVPSSAARPTSPGTWC